MRKSLRRNPEAAEIWYVKGLAFRGLGQHQNAVGAFERALELDSTLEAAWEQKGLALLGLNRYEEARQAFNSVLILNPKNVNALLQPLCSQSQAPAL